ncbi:DUF4249 domain-containing protein [Hymenobacter jejuensis]|uniref:DUF4249 domain-containing protein n=1 Tax=Hymenobacter jejuensis TaxID=2502781 RepID=A0A5B7ZYL0_9BACT|nr:DUF4249 domain-containing protein [Hymenobacter jejuensis]QDA59533.1 DUF4249 domain-containing protein [Hymenobacter jejuensis]
MGYFSLLLRPASLWWALLLLALASCIDRFEPTVLNASVGYLVVDGSINLNGVSTVRLSRTQNLSSKDAPPAETKASVFIEQEGGLRFPLLETAPGVYASQALNLVPGKRYRLFFRTQKQQDFASDFVEAKTTPAIDSVTWQAGAQGLQFYVDAHDAANNTRYYRWDFEETWEFTSAYVSGVEYRNGQLTSRTGEDIFHCWRTEKSTAIKLGSTAKLGQDVIAHQPLTLLPPTSEKLGQKYSLLVRQYALTAAEFAYWELLQKNTESLGTLFDPLPSQLVGNVHALSDASETVIGFVGVQSVTEKRIFVDYGQLPRTWVFQTGYEKCVPPDTIPGPHDLKKPPLPLVIEFFKSGVFLPIEEIQIGTDPTKYYLYSSAECVDCRKRGTNKRPAFWQ